MGFLRLPCRDEKKVIIRSCQIFIIHNVTSFLMIQSDYQLRTVDDPILKKICDKVTDFSAIDHVVDTMHEIMNSSGGVELAAPQIGEAVRVVIAKIDSQVEEFINPEILRKRGLSIYPEMCMSIPDKFMFKIRRYSIDVRYQDRDGNLHTGTYEGLPSRILQHEIDHLDGRLITDRYDSVRRFMSNIF